MDKEYFKILIEKYLDGNASTAEVEELCGWIKITIRSTDGSYKLLKEAILISMRKSMNVCIPALKKT